MKHTQEILQRPLHFEADKFDTERRLYDDTTTWLAEVLPGTMETKFTYIFDGRELYAEDGSSLGEIFQSAIIDAERTAEQKPNLAFEVRRRYLEYEEYGLMLAMASGDAPNTMIVLSDFPPELMQSHHDVGGYNARRRQTMLRVVARAPDGTINMTTKSLDLSDRAALERVYGSLTGEAPQQGELLGQRVHLDLSAQDQLVLPEKLRQEYDASLVERYGGVWHSGRILSDKDQQADTYNFVCSQKTLLDAFIEAASGDRPSDRLLYGLAAEMENRYERYLRQEKFGEFTQETGAQAAAAMMVAATQASHEGRTFSGCGLSLGAQGQAAVGEMLASGFGNRSNNETSYRFNKYMHCRVCQPKPKKRERKKFCGPCGICRGCDKKLKVKNR